LGRTVRSGGHDRLDHLARLQLHHGLHLRPLGRTGDVLKGNMEAAANSKGSAMDKIRIPVQPLSRKAFEEFGDVIETDGAEHYSTNAGYAERFHDLARIECS